METWTVFDNFTHETHIGLSFENLNIYILDDTKKCWKRACREDLFVKENYYGLKLGSKNFPQKSCQIYEWFSFI